MIFFGFSLSLCRFDRLCPELFAVDNFSLTFSNLYDACCNLYNSICIFFDALLWGILRRSSTTLLFGSFGFFLGGAVAESLDVRPLDPLPRSLGVVKLVGIGFLRFFPFGTPPYFCIVVFDSMISQSLLDDVAVDCELEALSTRLLPDDALRVRVVQVLTVSSGGGNAG